ncbi:MAG: HAD-IA family hydrolase [Chloroflexi bacterium]|nr:HAD-IA family hydrolase [Chloroflexota bacterium]
MYHAILFDFDDTLISLRGCESEALRRSLDEASLTERFRADFATVSASFAAISNRYWGERSAKGYSREQVLEASLRDLLAHFDLDAVLANGLAQIYWREFCRSSALNPGALDTLQQLSRRYRLGLITNGYIDSQRGRLDAARLSQFFDPILISEEVGIAKPDARIFKMALDALDLSASDVIYVGDSIGHDYAGCRNAGIDFCLYSPDLATDGPLPDVKYRIGYLPDLVNLLAADS